MMWIDGFRHRRAIRQLQLRYDRYETKAQAAIEDAEKRRERDEYDSLVSEYLFERDEFEEEIRWLETQFLTRQARRYLIPVPPTEEGPHWEKSEHSRRFLLKLDAMRDLRAAIRDEQRQRLEPVKVWIPLLTGLIGSLIGLVSLLK
jgi:hypothetical protein